MAQVPRSRPLAAGRARSTTGHVIAAVADSLALSGVQPRQVAGPRPREGITVSMQSNNLNRIRVSHSYDELKRGNGTPVTESAPATWPGGTALWALADLSTINAAPIDFEGQHGAYALSPATIVRSDNAHVHGGVKSLRIDPSGRGGDPNIGLPDKPYDELVLFPPFSQGPWRYPWLTIASPGRYSVNNPQMSMTDTGAGQFADVASAPFPVTAGQRIYLKVVSSGPGNPAIRMYYGTTSDFGSGSPGQLTYTAGTTSTMSTGLGLVPVAGFDGTVTVPAGVTWARLVLFQPGGAGTVTVNPSACSMLIGAGVVPLGFTADTAEEVAATFWLWTQRGQTYRSSLRVRSGGAPNLVDSPDLTEPTLLAGCTTGYEGYTGPCALSGPVAGEEGIQITDLGKFAMPGIPVVAGESITVSFRSCSRLAGSAIDVSAYWGQSPAFSANQQTAPLTQCWTETPAVVDTWATHTTTIVVPPNATHMRLVTFQWGGTGGKAIVVRSWSVTRADPTPADDVSPFVTSSTDLGATVTIGRGGWQSVTVTANIRDTFPSGDPNIILMVPDGHGDFTGITFAGIPAGLRWTPQLQIESRITAWVDDIRAAVVDARCNIIDHIRTDL